MGCRVTLHFGLEPFMANRQAGSVLAAVEILLRNRDERSDGELLREFLDMRTEDAFAALVRRHGAMVFGVCRRVLGNADDADDAVQATFLVLAMKARTFKARSSLADWLHGVARRTALDARRRAARRREMEKRIEPRVGGDGNDLGDILPVLDEELARLPEKYRLPIVLCDLEGKSRGVAARQLNWPEGSVAGRLARGRQLLARRLAKRGVSLTASALAASLGPESATACGSVAMLEIARSAAAVFASGSLVESGVVSGRVLALTQGALKAISLSKMKSVVAMAIASLGLAWGAGLVVHGGAAVQTEQVQKEPSKQNDDRAAKDPLTIFDEMYLGIIKDRAIAFDDVNAVHKATGQSLLAAAFRHGYGKMARGILETGKADLSHRDLNDNNALHALVKWKDADLLTLTFEKYRETAAKMMLDRNRAGWSPLEVAYYSHSLDSEMIKAIESLIAVDKATERFVEIQQLKRLLRAIAAKDFNGLVELLRQNKKLANAVDPEGTPPLLFAGVGDNLGSVHILLQYGANPLGSERSAMSPVEWALAYDRPEVFRALRIHGVKLDDRVAVFAAAGKNRSIKSVEELVKDYGKRK
jgi:RNA polymerase sigma factor (sigma-70 family)